jgi:hypothetical protein
MKNGTKRKETRNTEEKGRRTFVIYIDMLDFFCTKKKKKKCSRK